MLFGFSVVLLLASFILAAPTTSVHSPVAPLSHSSRTSSHSLSTQRPHSTLTIYRPFPLTIGPQSSLTEFPEPSRTRKADDDQSVRETAQRNATITLGVIAGTVILGFLVAIFRCMYKYKRPPKRDRIAEVLQRHNLQCEMEELERNPYALRRTSLREPAPPYLPRPPSYSESVMEGLQREGNVSGGTEHSRNDSTSSSTNSMAFPIAHH